MPRTLFWFVNILKVTAGFMGRCSCLGAALSLLGQNVDLCAFCARLALLDKIYIAVRCNCKKKLKVTAGFMERSSCVKAKPLVAASLWQNVNLCTSCTCLTLLGYHYITIIYLITRREPIRRFLILQGTGISLGWYAALWFGHILYMNMPTILKQEMFDESTADRSIKYMSLSHILDTILHPDIVCFLLVTHCREIKATKTIAKRRFYPIVTWKNNIIALLCVSRFWSMLHTGFNDGKIKGWYFGYDVYHLHNNTTQFAGAYFYFIQWAKL